MSSELEPIIVVRCFCSSCRSYIGTRCTETALFFKAGYKRQGGPIDYSTTSALWGICSFRRGKCAQCHDYLGGAGQHLLGLVVSIPAKIFDLEPRVNIFYNRALDPLPSDLEDCNKYYSSWMSWLVLAGRILSAMLLQLPVYFVRKLHASINNRATATSATRAGKTALQESVQMRNKENYGSV